MFFFLVLFFLIFTFIAARNLRWAIFLILAALPSYLIRFELLGVPMTVLEGMILIVFLTWLVKKVKSEIRNPPHPPFDKGGKEGFIQISNFRKYFSVSLFLCLFVSLFLLSATIGMFVSPNLRAGTLSVPIATLSVAAGVWKAYFIEPILFFIVLISELGNSKLNSQNSTVKTQQFIITALGISAFYISIYAIAQRFFGVAIPAPWQAEMRVTSIFSYPNAVGLYLAPLIPLFVYQLISNYQLPISNKITNLKSQILNYLGIGYWVLVIFLSLASIYFAKTEAALVALAVGLIFFLLFYNNKTRLVLVLLFLCFFLLRQGFGGQAVSTFLRGNLFPTVENKLLLKDWSGMTRTTMWSETWQMLKDKPIYGAGLAGYQTAILPYHKAGWMEIFLYPHNIIFNLWSEVGLLGLLSFLLIVGWFFKQIFWNLGIRHFIGNWELGIGNFRTTITDKRLMLALASSMLVLLIHGLVDVPYFKNDLAVLFWVIISLPIILKNDKLEQD